jgi:hypothetical protein
MFRRKPEQEARAMNPLLTWWDAFAELPWSGDVSQVISPRTNWSMLEVNFAGDRRIEADLVSNVASYGKQLGALTKAVLELADDAKGPAVTRLRELAAQIEERKREHRKNLEEDLRRSLDEVQKTDPAMLERVLSRYAK